jgi:hypothetical protein
LCTVAPLLYLLSDLLPPPPLPNVQYIQTVCDCGGGGEWGGVKMYCGPYSARVLHSVSDQIQNLPNCFTTPNKMTSEDDTKGLVSLKFLRPWQLCTSCTLNHSQILIVFVSHKKAAFSLCLGRETIQRKILHNTGISKQMTICFSPPLCF